MLLGFAACRQSPPIDPALLENGFSAQFARTINNRIHAGNYGQIASLLIWQDDELRLESYFQGDENSLRDQYSITKSVVSAAVGIALHENHLPSLQQPIAAYFPEWRSPDPNANQITIAHLLTMSAGWEWDEISHPFGSDKNNISALENAPNWENYVLGRPLANQPGDLFTYNSGGTALLAPILRQATGGSVEDYVADKIFAPLEIRHWEWDANPQGEANTGWGLHLKSGDMLQFGRLFLNQGGWQGEQIMPASWVAQSTKTHITVDDDAQYGYLWWRFADSNPTIASLETNDLFYAAGYAGQYIFVVPHLDLVVIVTANNQGDGSLFFKALEEMILPAAQAKSTQ